MNMVKCFFFISLCLSTMVVHANKLSISGKPQDEAHCAMLSSPHVRNNDKRCKKTEIKKTDEWYEVNFSFIDSDLKGSIDQNTKACAKPGDRGNESDLYVSVQKQLVVAAENNIDVSIQFQAAGLGSCVYKLKTKSKQAICSYEWGLLGATPLLKVEILTGNIRDQKRLDWKDYCKK